MSIKITTDSTCDLSPEFLSAHNVEVLPLYIIKDGIPYKDSLEISPQDIFQHVSQGGAITTTSAVNVEDYIDCFQQLSQQHEAIIHIDISSDFSSCYQNACIAAESFPNVFVVDSRNLSTGHGLVVVEAVQAAERGMSAPDIVSMLNELIGRVEASFVIDQLTYLHKGGRCSTVAALGANLLKLKPCIEVSDGKMHVGKKYRGAFEKVILDYVRDRLQGRTDLDLRRIFITHTTSPDIVESVKAEVQKYANFEEIITTTAGCTISNHCGPNTLGVLFIRSK